VKRVIPLIVRQSTAEVATGLGIEQFHPRLAESADGVCLSGDEMIEGRISEAASVRSYAAMALSISCSFTARRRLV
jgi:hypothetical protein